MNKHQVIISVGSNIDPEENCRKTESVLSQEHIFVGKSDYILTKPVGFQDQPDFLNGAYLMETDLPYKEFKAYLKNVERRIGRLPSAIKSGPRVIDLDIILWDREVVHQDFYSKEYVQIPLKQLGERFSLAIPAMHTGNPSSLSENKK